MSEFKMKVSQFGVGEVTIDGVSIPCKSVKIEVAANNSPRVFVEIMVESYEIDVVGIEKVRHTTEVYEDPKLQIIKSLEAENKRLQERLPTPKKVSFYPDFLKKGLQSDG